MRLRWREWERWRRAAAVVAVALVVVTVVVLVAGDDPPDGVVVGWDAVGWTASGDLLDDRDVLARAIDAVGDIAPADRWRVLFAGAFGDREVVALGLERTDEDLDCLSCVFTIVDGEVTTEVRPRPEPARELLFDEGGERAFLAPLEVPDADGDVYAVPSGATAEVVGSGGGPSDDHGSLLRVRGVPEGSRTCDSPVVTMSGDRNGTYALVRRSPLGDRTGVVRVESLASDDDAAVELGVGRSLVGDLDCDAEPDRLLVDDVLGRPVQRRTDHARAGKVTAAMMSDRPALADGRRGRALLLEWAGPDGDVVAGAWQDEASDVYVGRPVRRTSRAVHPPSGDLSPTETHVLGLGAFDLETVPGGGLVMVTAPLSSTRWTADAGGADVLASTRDLLVVAEPGRTPHVVTVADEAGTPLDALVIGG